MGSVVDLWTQVKWQSRGSPATSEGDLVGIEGVEEQELNVSTTKVSYFIVLSVETVKLKVKLLR